MSSECKFEVGKRYRNGEGTEVVIERVDGNYEYNGVPMPIEGREVTVPHRFHAYQLNGRYLDDGESCDDLIPEPIDDNADEVIELEPVTADADEIAPGALVKPEQLELAREMCREGVEFWINSKDHSTEWFCENGHGNGWIRASADHGQQWSDSWCYVRRGPKPDSPPQAAPDDEIIDVEIIDTEPASVLPDSGDRTEFSTGAVRDAMSGKGLPSLVPPAAVRSLARRFEDGATKYGRENWLKGIPLSRYVDAIIRHTLAAAEGQTDEDHLGAVLWNAAAWIETERRIQCQQLPDSLDDLPYRE